MASSKEVRKRSVGKQKDIKSKASKIKEKRKK